jgi:uncharacterized membrane protein YjgN (DUF898 family)
MSQFGGGGPLPPGQSPPPFRPPAGPPYDWPGRAQGFPPPPPGSIRRKLGVKPTEVEAAFDLKTPGVLRLAIVGSLLQFITLGIYRFWFLVHLRRQLWQRASLAGSPFEYTGTPGEIFRGFLIALIILLPMWVSYAAGTAMAQTAQYRVLAGFLVAFAVIGFAFFTYFAIYRGRRYRISRTLWRGVRFRQTGSGALYALMNFGWWFLVLPTLGLSIPFARAQLERYRINHMWFGNRRFASTASGRMMLGPFLLYYLSIFGPVLIGLAAWLLSVSPDFWATFSSDVKALGSAITNHTQVTHGSSQSVVAAVLGVLAIVWLCVMPIVLWPLYRACELRRFIGRVAFGATTFRSTFPATEIYICYIIFLLILSGVFTSIGMITGIGMGMGAGLGWMAGAGQGAATGAAIGAGVFIFLSYLLMLLGLSVLRIRIFLFELTSRLIATVIVDRIDHLEDVISHADRVGAVGDDFAGGFDIGAI